MGFLISTAKNSLYKDFRQGDKGIKRLVFLGFTTKDTKDTKKTPSLCAFFVLSVPFVVNLLLRILFEDDDVLGRKDFERLDPVNRVRLHFFTDLFLRHLVDELDPDLGIFESVFHKHEAAAGFDKRTKAWVISHG